MLSDLYRPVEFYRLGDGCAYLTQVVIGPLNGYNSVAALRHRRAGHDTHRISGFQL